jgi:hypothetical protein
MGGGTGYWYSAEEAAIDDPANDAALTEAVAKTLEEKKSNAPKGQVEKKCTLKSKSDGIKASQNKSNDKKCNFSALKITKNERKFTLVVDRDTPAEERKLSIIAGFQNNKARVTAELVDFYGPHQCAHVNKKTFNTGSFTPKKYPGNTDHRLIVGLTSGTKIKIFPWGYQPLVIPVSASRCSHPSEKATIEVYPDTEAEVKIAYDWGERKKDTSSKREITSKRLNNQASKPNMRKATQTDTNVTKTEREAGLSLEGTLKYDGNDYNIELAFKRTIETIKKVEKVVTKVVKSIKAIKKDLADAAIEDVFESPVGFGIKLPKVAFGISGKWEEKEGKPDVDYKGTFKLEADPFIGLNFEWNVTDTILQTFPAGTGAKKILKALKTSLMELVLSASGEIAGELELEIEGWEIENVSGKIQGKIPITAELTAIKYEGNIFVIHLSAEIKGGIEGGFFGEIGYDHSEKKIECKAGMLNLAIWYSVMIMPGVAEEDTDENTVAEDPVEGVTTKGELKIEPTGKSTIYELELEEEAIEIFTYKFKEQ